MPPVFAHGRLRLYLLKLLDEAPRHGYEVIRLLEERFQGRYAPSAGTVYPRLAKLEAEGLVTHTTEGGRKVYATTDAGRAELAHRAGELADLELEIRDSVAELAAEIRADTRGAEGEQGALSGNSTEYPDNEAWWAAREELRRVRQEWKEQARRARDESRRARAEAQRARHQAEEAQERAREQVQEEMRRIARRVQEQVRDHFAHGDRPTGIREGLTELAKEFGDFGNGKGKDSGNGSDSDKDHGNGNGNDRGSGGAGRSARAPEYAPAPEDLPAGYEPSWVHEASSTGDPARDLDRLLDRFRDDIRDAARDHGVTPGQLDDTRRHLSAAAAHIGALLRPPKP